MGYVSTGMDDRVSQPLVSLMVLQLILADQNNFWDFFQLLLISKDVAEYMEIQETYYLKKCIILQ